MSTSNATPPNLVTPGSVPPVNGGDGAPGGSAAFTIDPTEEWDNLHTPTRPDSHWSTDNVGEAAPGVLSPLGASIWSDLGERSTRGTFVEIGVLARRERRAPERPEDKILAVFCGRYAISVELMCTLGDRLPGTSGQELAKAMLGKVPDDIEYNPTIRRYPVLAWKLSRVFFGMPARLRKYPPQVQRWWRDSIDALHTADLPTVRRILSDALSAFEEALQLQATSVCGHSQIIYEALDSLVREAGVGDLGVLSGAGGAELAVVTDIWRAAQGEVSLEEVVRRHGFHGPLEGDVSSTVWREDITPLRRMMSEYAGREDPRLRAAEIRARLPEEQAKVLAALPRSKRPGAKLLLVVAARRMPLRGVAKRSFVQAIDVIRACARRIGTDLADRRLLATADDVFYLTVRELFDLPTDAKELVAKRRARGAEYLGVTIPGSWKGLPEATVREAWSERSEVTVVEGIGVSAGVVEGVARVITDPSFADVEPNEILVSPTTDPSWASIMYISSALVVDMGGPISHAAVVARELGLPCVVNTRNGTQMIRTGDRIRVDGQKGTVEILVPCAT